MNTKNIETSDESIKALLQKLAENEAWNHDETSQITHKLAVALWILDAAEMPKGEKRDSILEAWMKTPSGFGCNASQLAQALSLRKAKAKSLANLKGF